MPEMSMGIMISALVLAAILAYMLRDYLSYRNLKALLPEGFTLVMRARLGDVLNISPEAEKIIPDMDQFCSYRVAFLICDAQANPRLIIAKKQEKRWDPRRGRQDDASEEHFDQILELVVAQVIRVSGREIHSKSVMRKLIRKHL